MFLAIVVCSDINPSLFSPIFDGKAQKTHNVLLFLTLVSSVLLKMVIVIPEGSGT